MRARATGEFTRAELTKAGNVTELPKNFTDYEEGTPSSGNGGGNSGGSNGDDESNGD